ncbi:ABC transporter ATP-binding protein [Porphyromonadaceae bacterium OttesenSCG-928-L07]|nr:ABC transporter ATP-binding protein [Porphyromonadaceae bacterium OttesenSCG-928-L07]
MAFLEIKNLDFSYTSGQKVLDDISFSLNKGETLSIVGASGCGKSTLLRIISSILPKTNDNILDGSVSINNLTTGQYRQTGKLSFMFQDSTLMPNLNVKKNIEFPLRIKGLKNQQKIEDLIKIVGLEKFISFLPKELSGGMKTRVSLARSFVTEPELLLLDEPFSALDIAWKSKLYVELEKLREYTKTTIVIVTHDVQEALLLADHIVVLNNLGSIETMKEISSEFSTMERVDNITEYMNSIYESHMLPIQDAIINGQNKMR